MSRKRSEKVKDKSDKGNVGVEEDPSKITDEYECSGSLETDFPGLCALLGMKDIPAVSAKQPACSNPETDGGNMEDSQSQMKTAPLWSKPCLQVELESEDPRSVKSIKVFGWKVDELIARVLNKTLPSLSKLQSLQLWQAGLTDRMVISLRNTLSLCSNLRTVTLEGNPLPQQSYHLLLSEDSVLTHLSLRNNRIGDGGARLIGSALSTARSANKNLLSLNLAFNCIGDAGAAHIAQGLRLNRALLCLSLSNNQVGDSGAAHLATILGQFALTHKEVVERRKLFLERDQSPSLGVCAELSPTDRPPSMPSSTSLSGKGASKGTSKKRETAKRDEKPAANLAGATAKKEDPKPNKKSSDLKVPRGKGGKLGGKEKHPSVSEQELAGLVEIVSPLLEQSAQHRDGHVILPGNAALTSLNLAGNRITERSLPLFLSALQMQTEGGGLLRLSLQRNRFPPDCESHVKIQELMMLRDPLNKPGAAQTEEEGQGT
ncbi:leucine-rich repeat-containing protein 71 [Centroberyx gerrardi]